VDMQEHIDKIVDILVGSTLQEPMRSMVLNWFKNRPSNEIQEKLSLVKRYLNEQKDI